MKLLMCVDCGEFTAARPEVDGPRPLADACPHCGGGSFKNTETDEIVRCSS